MALDPITAGIDLLNGFGTKLIERIWPDPAERAKASLELEKMRQEGVLAQMTMESDLAKGQMAINQVEASSSNWFVSSWRPAAGWFCAFGLGYQAIFQPFMVFMLHAFGSDVVPPDIDSNLLTSCLFGMLGLGVQRTYEKQKGITAVEPGH